MAGDQGTERAKPSTSRGGLPRSVCWRHPRCQAPADDRGFATPRPLAPDYRSRLTPASTRPPSTRPPSTRPPFRSTAQLPLPPWPKRKRPGFAPGLKFAGGRPTNRGVMDGTPHRFRLERIRSLRERSEDRAKQALAESLNRERTAADAVAAAAARIADARESLAVVPGVAVDAATLFAHQTYLERTEAAHRASLSSLAGARRGVGERRGELIEAARARQSLDRLRDRSLAAHLAESGRRERAALDEIALNGFRRKAAA